VPPWLCWPALQRWSNVSRLFSKEGKVWAVYEAQALYENGTGFVGVSEYDLFRMRPFGYRTRFQRILERSDYSRRQELAEWLVKQLRLKDPSSHIVAIRFIEFPSSSVSTKRSVAHYQQGTSNDVPPSVIQVVSTHTKFN